MKKLFGLLATGLLISSSLFATAPIKTKGNKAVAKKDMIMFSPLHAKRGIDVRIRNLSGGKAVVVIYDEYGNTDFKDISQSKAFEKGYILNRLDEGDYTVEVTLNKQDIKKNIHVYDQGTNKCVSITTGN